MRAERGDWLIIERAGVDQAPRKGLIIEVRSADGSPPYRVRWGGSGHTTLMFPGSDARVLNTRDGVRRASAFRSAGPTRSRRASQFWRRLLHWRKA